jgi:hypothetical protein
MVRTMRLLDRIGAAICHSAWWSRNGRSICHVSEKQAGALAQIIENQVEMLPHQSLVTER